MANPGPAVQNTVNTQVLRGDLQFVQTIAVSMTPASVATITVAEQSFGLAGTNATAATGILPGDVILAVCPPSTTAGVGISQFRVDTSTADKFYVSFVNPTAGSLTPPSGVYLITVARFNSSQAGQTIPIASGSTFNLATLPSALTAN